MYVKLLSVVGVTYTAIDCVCIASLMCFVTGISTQYRLNIHSTVTCYNNKQHLNIDVDIYTDA